MRHALSFRRIAGVALLVLGLHGSGPATAGEVDVRAERTISPSPEGEPGIERASCSRFVYEELDRDPRTAAVRDFLESYSCPVTELAVEFVLAAEVNGLDYRLLPVLALLETGCGKATRNNNLFGWANGRKPFATAAQGIHFVAQRLRLAPHYAGKTLPQKLRVYNRRSWYRKRVLAMMDRMPAGEAATPSAPAVAEGFE